MLRDAEARVCVTAAGCIGFTVTGVRPGVAEVVPVIGDRLDIVVSVRVEMRAGLPRIARTLDHMEEVRNHAGLDEKIALLAPVHAPWIARPLGKDLEFLLLRMEPPDARIDLHAILVRGAGLP